MKLMDNDSRHKRGGTPGRGPIPFYPFLLGLYPVLAMYAHNADQLTPDSLILPILAVMVISAVSLLVMRLLCGGFRRGAIPAAVFITIFFLYGHVHMPLREYRPGQVVLSGLLLMAVAAIIVILSVILVRRRPDRSFPILTPVLNTVTVLLIVVPLIRIIAYELQAPRHGYCIEHNYPDVFPEPAADNRPNILFLVPDRYPAESTLAEIYDYDNSGFLAELRSRGFYIADESRCNYGRTDMSLASVLNMEYLDSLLAQTDKRNLRRALYWAIQNGEVIRILKEEGYRYLHLGTSWHATSHGRNADANFNYMLLPEFMMMLYRTTIIYPVGALAGLDAHREKWERVNRKFDFIESLDTVPGPVFVFAHFLVPHEPYVLDAEGRFVARAEQFRRGTLHGFADQVRYVNHRLLALSDRLIEAGNPRPWAIIIQPDEGPHPPHNFEHTDSLQTLRAKFRILSAFYLPGLDTALLYQEITPVNTFRLIFNGYFGPDHGLLPDESYLVYGMETVRVTELVRYNRSVSPGAVVSVLDSSGTLTTLAP